MDRTRVSVPTKTNSKMKLFQVKLPLWVTKETAESQKKKNDEVPTLKPKKQVTVTVCEVQAIVEGPVITRVVIALWNLTREVNSLQWVVGLSFRLSKAIPKKKKSLFLSEFRNHPSEPGESG